MKIPTILKTFSAMTVTTGLFVGLVATNSFADDNSANSASVSPAAKIADTSTSTPSPTGTPTPSASDTPTDSPSPSSSTSTWTTPPSTTIVTPDPSNVLTPSEPVTGIFDNVSMASQTISLSYGSREMTDLGVYALNGSQVYNLSLNLNVPAQDSNGNTYEYYFGTVDNQISTGDPSLLTLDSFHHQSTDFWAKDYSIDSLPGYLEAGTTLNIPVKFNSGATPGVYTVSLPLHAYYFDAVNLQYVDVASTTVSTRITVNANPENGKLTTIVKKSGKKGKHSRVTVRFSAPQYYAGNSVKVYYKAKGKKSYKYIGKGTVSGSSHFSSIKLGKGKIRKSGKLYLKIGSVDYAPGYNTNTIKV